MKLYDHELANAIGDFTNTLTKLNLMDFGNVWEWELELYEYWAKKIKDESIVRDRFCHDTRKVKSS